MSGLVIPQGNGWRDGGGGGGGGNPPRVASER